MEYFRFIQQEVQNLLHEIERRDNECRRLNHQAINSEQKLEKTSDKLQTIESRSVTQAKEIKVSSKRNEENPRSILFLAEEISRVN